MRHLHAAKINYNASSIIALKPVMDKLCINAYCLIII